jgi:hypothetical protein
VETLHIGNVELQASEVGGSWRAVAADTLGGIAALVAHCRSSGVFGAHPDAGLGMVDHAAAAAAAGHQAHCLSSSVGAFGVEVPPLQIPASR